MGEIIGKAVAFMAVILLGAGLRKIGFLKKEDFHLLSRIVLKITLPAAIVTNFSSITMENSLLLMILFGLGGNIVMVVLGYLGRIRGTADQRGFEMINLAGYNVGNFAMPFIQNFMGPVGLGVTSFFDVGNAVMCTGITFTAASLAVGIGDKFSLKTCIRSLLSSVPFDTYLIMTVLAVAGISLPRPVLVFAQTAGGANAFLSLLMIGIGFEIQLNRETMAELARLLGMRYVIAVGAAVACYLFLPFSQEIRETLTILMLAPVSSICPAFTAGIGGDVGLSSAMNSMSIVVSTCLMTAAMILIL